MEYFQLWLYRKVPFFVLQLCFGFSRKFIHLVIGCCGRARFVPAVSLPDLASHIACLLFVDHNPCSKLCTLTYIWRQGLLWVLWLHFQGFTDHNALKCTRYAFLIVPDWRSCTLSNYFSQRCCSSSCLRVIELLTIPTTIHSNTIKVSCHSVNLHSEPQTASSLIAW